MVSDHEIRVRIKIIIIQCFYLGYWEATFFFTFGKIYYKNGKISTKIHEIGKIKAIFGLEMTPI